MKISDDFQVTTQLDNVPNEVRLDLCILILDTITEEPL